MQGAAWTTWVEAMSAGLLGGAVGWFLSPLVEHRHPAVRRWERPALALVTSGLCIAMSVYFEPILAVLSYGVLCAGLVVLTAIDLHTRRLPREISYTTLAIGAPLLVVAALVAGEPRRAVTMTLGALLALVLMALLYVLSRGGLGDGDVRMSPLLGAYLGWLSLGHVPVGLFLGFLFGAVGGVVAMVAGSEGRKTTIPFGPFLAAGTVAAVLGGQQVIDALWAP